MAFESASSEAVNCFDNIFHQNHKCRDKHKVINDTYELSWGIQEVDEHCPLIDAFLSAVPQLCEQPETFGMIWNKNLRPNNGSYELGEHYCRTRDAVRRSAHGIVTFHRDGESGAKFAIKTLQMSEVFNPLEVRPCRSHKNICKVYGIIIRNMHVNILLEYAGVPLMSERDWLSESSERKLEAAKQCFEALEYLASESLVHCDIKPDNLTIIKNGSEFTIKLIDFGSCQEKGIKMPSKVHTTLEYWAPEIWAAQEKKTHLICDPSFDVYAMALTIYFLETSHHLTQRIQDLKIVMLTMPGMVKLLGLPDSLPADLRVMMAACLEEAPQARLTAAQAVLRLQDASIPAVLLQTLTKPQNYQKAWNDLVKKFTTKVPPMLQLPVELNPSKLREKLNFRPQSPHVDFEFIDLTSDESKIMKPPTKSKVLLKSPLSKAKDLKMQKAVSLKCREKDLVTNLNNSSSFVNGNVANVLKNLALKAKQSPLPYSGCKSLEKTVTYKNESKFEHVNKIPCVSSMQCLAPQNQTLLDTMRDNASVKRSEDSNLHDVDVEIDSLMDVIDEKALTGEENDICEYLFKQLNEPQDDKRKAVTCTSRETSGLAEENISSRADVQQLPDFSLL